jgi:cobalamin biosynthesis protein CbiG
LTADAGGKLLAPAVVTTAANTNSSASTVFVFFADLRLYTVEELGVTALNACAIAGVVTNGLSSGIERSCIGDASVCRTRIDSGLDLRATKER